MASIIQRNFCIYLTAVQTQLSNIYYVQKKNTSKKYNPKLIVKAKIKILD